MDHDNLEYQSQLNNESLMLIRLQNNLFIKIQAQNITDMKTCIKLNMLYDISYLLHPKLR